MNKMFYTVAIIMAILGQLTHGVPLEGPSSNYSQFFESRIVGGSDAPLGKAPHMVALLVGWLWSSFVCGASIISESCILTAAHCITGLVQWDGELLSSFHGRVGSNKREHGTIVRFSTYRNHPRYDSWLIKYDVGILITVDKIKMGKLVAPIALFEDWVDGGIQCFVTGWGTDRLWGTIPDELQYLAVKTISPKQCSIGIKEAAENWGGWAPPIDPDVEICTFHSPGHGMCHGDSGSALVCFGKQVGIVSWGIPCARGGPDVFGRVGGLLKFIKAILAEFCCGHKDKEHRNEEHKFIN